ncbi:MAG: peptidoglycan-binding domain-containing protein [Candidatus Binatia bacterium]
MKKKVLSSLVLSGAVFVMAPQAWSQADKSSGSGATGSGKSGSETQMQKPSDPPMGGQQRSSPGSSSDLQRERGSARGGMQGQRTAGQQLSKDKVKAIQEALKDKGNDPGQIDGIMGPKTQQALRAFQKSENLQVTGRVDEKTASALGVEVAGGSGSSSTSPSMESKGSGSSLGSGKSPSSGRESTGSAPGSSSGKSSETKKPSESPTGNK